jgi:BolA protein
MQYLLIDLIEQRLAVLEPHQFKLQDDSASHRGHRGNTSGGSHFELSIASKKFAGLTTISCHRLVYEQLADLIPNPIHALSIKIIR